jgi:hypothetical protein
MFRAPIYYADTVEDCARLGKWRQLWSVGYVRLYPCLKRRLAVC